MNENGQTHGVLLLTETVFYAGEKIERQNAVNEISQNQ